MKIYGECDDRNVTAHGILYHGEKKDKVNLPETPSLCQRNVGKASAGTMSQYIMKSIHKLTAREEDPREALMRYHTQATVNPQYVAPAYKSIYVYIYNIYNIYNINRYTTYT